MRVEGEVGGTGFLGFYGEAKRKERRGVRETRQERTRRDAKAGREGVGKDTDFDFQHHPRLDDIQRCGECCSYTPSERSTEGCLVRKGFSVEKAVGGEGSFEVLIEGKLDGREGDLSVVEKNENKNEREKRVERKR